MLMVGIVAHRWSGIGFPIGSCQANAASNRAIARPAMLTAFPSDEANTGSLLQYRAE